MDRQYDSARFRGYCRLDLPLFQPREAVPAVRDNQNTEAPDAPFAPDENPFPLPDESVPARTRTSIRRAWPTPEASQLPSSPAPSHKTLELVPRRPTAWRVVHDRSR